MYAVSTAYHLVNMWCTKAGWSPKWLCDVPEMQYFDWWGETLRNIRDLQATLDGASRKQVANSKQLTPACGNTNGVLVRVHIEGCECALVADHSLLANRDTGGWLRYIETSVEARCSISTTIDDTSLDRH
jgi:hypothetical protein